MQDRKGKSSGATSGIVRRSPKRAADRRDGPQGHPPVAAGLDTPPSNTVSNSYGNGHQAKILLIGVDSLYLSYCGELGSDVAFALLEKKLLAQSRLPSEQAMAQWPVGSHLFEVSDKGQRVKGQGGFAFILEDNAFRICLSSSESRSLPMAYVKVSSEYLAHEGPEVAEQKLTEVIATFGEAERYPTVSRLDLFVDFQADIDFEAFPRKAWVTRAGSINRYSVRHEFSGWTVGAGGPISCRLYNKTLELLKSHKTYFLPLWQRSGMNPDQPVWRLEFQVMREVVQQLGVHSFESLKRNLGGIWAYATQTWLRLAIPQEDDSNRARWPTHPIWQRFENVRWRLDDVPLTRKFTAARVPSQDRLMRFYMSLLTSFMAVHKLKSYAEGAERLQAACAAFHATRCQDKLKLTFEEWVAQEVSIKGRRFNTLRNIPSLKEDSERSDKVDAHAVAYYKATKGE